MDKITFNKYGEDMNLSTVFDNVKIDEYQSIWNNSNEFVKRPFMTGITSGELLESFSEYHDWLKENPGKILEVYQGNYFCLEVKYKSGFKFRLVQRQVVGYSLHPVEERIEAFYSLVLDKEDYTFLSSDSTFYANKMGRYIPFGWGVSQKFIKNLGLSLCLTDIDMLDIVGPVAKQFCDKNKNTVLCIYQGSFLCLEMKYDTTINNYVYRIKRLK